MSDMMRNRNRGFKRKTPTLFLWIGVVIGIVAFAACFVEAIAVSTIWRTKTASEGTVVSCNPKQVYHDLITLNELKVRYRVLEEGLVDNRQRVKSSHELSSIFAQWSCNTANPQGKMQVFYAASNPDIAMTQHRYNTSLLTVVIGTLAAVGLLALCGGRIYARARAKILAEYHAEETA